MNSDLQNTTPRGAPLSDDATHVRWLLADDAGPELDAQALAWMTPDERARHDRYVFEHSRELHRLTRWLVRRTLSRFAPVDPADWRFITNPHGRPEVAYPEEFTQIRFNATNTAGLVAVAVVHGRDVGIDAENISRRSDVVALAPRFFAPAEAADVSALPDDASRRERFFAYWTLKEAYIKARGLGLALPLGAFSFSLGDDAIRIAFDARISDDATTWRFFRWQPTALHRMALAVRHVAEGEPTIDLVRERPDAPDEI